MTDKKYVPISSRWKAGTPAFELVRLMRDRTTVDLGLSKEDIAGIMFGKTDDNTLKRVKRTVKQIRDADPDGLFLVLYPEAVTNPKTAKKEFRYWNRVTIPDAQPVCDQLTASAEGMIDRVKKIGTALEEPWYKKKKKIAKRLEEAEKAQDDSRENDV